MRITYRRRSPQWCRRAPANRHHNDLLHAEANAGEDANAANRYPPRQTELRLVILVRGHHSDGLDKLDYQRASQAYL